MSCGCLLLHGTVVLHHEIAAEAAICCAAHASRAAAWYMLTAGPLQLCCEGDAEAVVEAQILDEF